MSAVTAAPPASHDRPATRYLNAELFALGRRPGVRIAVVAWFAQILVFAYAIQYIVYRAMGEQLDPAQAGAMLGALGPDLVGTYVAASVPGYGIPVFVVLGALVAASDYRFGTWGTLLSRCPRRTTFLLARYGALLVVLAVTAILTVLLGLLASGAITAIEGRPLVADPGDLAAGVVGVWLMSVGFATFGFALGLLLRSVLTAAVAGMVWLIGVEMLLVGGLAGALPAVDALRSGLLTANVGSVASALDTGGVTAGQGLPGAGAVNEGWVAVLVILVWSVVGLLLALRLFRRRDVM